MIINRLSAKGTDEEMKQEVPYTKKCAILTTGRLANYNNPWR